MRAQRRKLPPPTEHAEATILCEWMDIRGIFYFHCPSEGKRSFALARYLQAEGMVPGVPDYIILSKPAGPTSANWPAGFSCKPPVFLELKRVGGKLSETQASFLGRLDAEGYTTVVAYGADEAICALTGLGY